MKALWGRAACTMTDMAMVLSEGGGAGDLCSMPIMQLQMLRSMRGICHRCFAELLPRVLQGTSGPG